MEVVPDVMVGAASQMRRVLSEEAEARRRPSGCQARARTRSVCPVGERSWERESRVAFVN